MAKMTPLTGSFKWGRILTKQEMELTSFTCTYPLFTLDKIESICVSFPFNFALMCQGYYITLLALHPAKLSRCTASEGVATGSRGPAGFPVKTVTDKEQHPGWRSRWGTKPLSRSLWPQIAAIPVWLGVFLKIILQQILIFPSDFVPSFILGLFAMQHFTYFWKEEYTQAVFLARPDLWN